MSAFPRDTHLTTIAIAYKNPEYALIADSIFPRNPVGKRLFRWYEYPSEAAYTVPDTRVGERSRPNQVQLSGVPRDSSCEDFGLDIPLSDDDIKGAPKGVDPREKATERSMNLILLDREIRCAALAFDASKYAAENKVDLSAGGQKRWTDATGNPLVDVVTGLNACLVRPNIMAFGQLSWTAFSMHPKVVSAALGNDGTSGIAPKARVAELLGLKEILVGEGWVNSVKPGKAPVLARVWGNHALAFFRDSTVDVTGGITYGLTAQYDTRVAGSRPDPDIGLRGGENVRAGESVKEVIVATKCAFFFANAVA